MGREVVMSSFNTIIEWGATLLSLYGSWLCIRHRVSCFVVFLFADLGWFASAWVNAHPSLLAQQFVYILLNILGFVMWTRDGRLRWQPATIQANRDFESFPRNRRYPQL